MLIYLVPALIFFGIIVNYLTGRTLTTPTPTKNSTTSFHPTPTKNSTTSFHPTTTTIIFMINKSLETTMMTPVTDLPTKSASDNVSNEISLFHTTKEYTIVTPVTDLPSKSDTSSDTSLLPTMSSMPSMDATVTTIITLIVNPLIELKKKSVWISKYIKIEFVDSKWILTNLRSNVSDEILEQVLPPQFGYEFSFFSKKNNRSYHLKQNICACSMYKFKINRARDCGPGEWIK